MCTRCVRFTREITQTGELEVMRRGNHAEIDIFPGHPVDNPLAGNVVDLCPVGALLDKDFLHKQRVWFLSKHDADLHPMLDRLQHQRRGEPGRALAVQAAVQPARQRLLDLRRGPLQLQGGQRPRPALGDVRPPGRRPPAVADRPGAQGGRPGPGADRRAGRHDRRGPLAVPDGRGSVPDGLVPQGPEPGQRAGARAGPGRGARTRPSRPDQTKGRTGDTSFVVPRPFTIHAEKCPNRRGVEAILEHFQGEVIAFDDLIGRIDGGRVPGALRRLGRASTPGSTRTEAQALREPRSGSWSCRTRRSRRWRSWPTSCWPGRRSPRRPAATSTPTAGSSTPRRPCRRATARCPTSTCSPSCSAAARGPVRSREVLAELAADRPGLRRRRGGQAPAFGVVLGEPEPVDGAAADPGSPISWFGSPQGSVQRSDDRAGSTEHRKERMRTLLDLRGDPRVRFGESLLR